MEQEIYFRIFRPDGRFVTACDDPRGAALMMRMLGDGASIRDHVFRRDILWLEGSEMQAANDNLDYVADTIMQRRTTAY